MSQTKAQLVDGFNINTSVPDDSLVIDSSGNVGIGTTSPGEKLDVSGTANATNLTRGGSQVYSRDNIVGTASESSGTPTGAIIEKGSNANGNYTKFADGTMICGFYKGSSSTGATTWTFPAAFSAIPYIASSGCRTITSGTGEGIGTLVPSGNFPATTTDYDYSFFLFSGIGNQMRFFSLNAFGTWY